jgi:glycosyltransferase involved in cell wall biosynthesis
VYNGAKYLEDCIQSILRQTFTDWEYVIFDNRSTDETIAISDRFAAVDSRIRVVRAADFSGVHGNHNRAIRAIDTRSRYCKFVHADDWLYPECLERMVTLAEENPSVGVVTAYRVYDERVDLDGVFRNAQRVIPGLAALRRAMAGKAWRTWVTGSPTSLLLRTELFRRRRAFFDETFWHADTEAAFWALTQSDLGFVHQVLTFTRSHPRALSSFTNRVNSYKPEEGRLLIRYGPRVLSPREYRKRTHRWFAAYGLYLSRQAFQPARLRDREFHDFHRREIDYLLTEAGGDAEARMILSLLRRFLRSATSGSLQCTELRGMACLGGSPI